MHMRVSRNHILRGIIASALLALSAQNSHAQGYPNPSKPISMTVNIAAGGVGDVIARVFSAKLGESDNVKVVVENKTGGGGIIGAQTVARSPADGYSLLTTHGGAITVMPFLQHLNYDPKTDLVPVVHLLSAPSVLVVHSSVPVKTVNELIAYAKANPGKLAYASQGVGATGHLAGEMLKLETGIDIVHVPYRGAAPAMQDLAAGNVQVMFSLYSSVQPLIEQGTLRILGAATNERISFLPDVPTLREQGLQLEMSAWFGLFAPASTPPHVIAWLNQRANALLKTPDVQARFAKQGATLPLGTSEEFGEYVKAEMTKFESVIRRSKMVLTNP
jgi:tripartite-type tricarboxylate transporter receptor subunit TctC